MSMALERRCLTETVKISKAYSLSTSIDVADCGYPIYSKAYRSMTVSYALRNTALISASVAEAITFLMIVHKMCTASLIGGIGSRSLPC